MQGTGQPGEKIPFKEAARSRPEGGHAVTTPPLQASRREAEAGAGSKCESQLHGNHDHNRNPKGGNLKSPPAYPPVIKGTPS